MSGHILSRSFLVSFLAHTALVSSLSFSFFRGTVIPGYPRLSFIGGMTAPGRVESSRFEQGVSAVSVLPARIAGPLPEAVDPELFARPSVYVKPPSLLAYAPVKSLQARVLPLMESPPRRKDPAIMFHPLLPYQLQLYFNDRQAVHIELEFSVEPGTQANSILVKRKVSSGNLEADLLSLRYMQHYLFIQQARFSPQRWQTIKIDLSTKNDQP